MKYFQISIWSIIFMILGGKVLKWFSVLTEMKCSPETSHAEDLLILILIMGSIAAASWLFDWLDH